MASNKDAFVIKFWLVDLSDLLLLSALGKTRLLLVTSTTVTEGRDWWAMEPWRILFFLKIHIHRKSSPP